MSVTPLKAVGFAPFEGTHKEKQVAHNYPLPLCGKNKASDPLFANHSKDAKLTLPAIPVQTQKSTAQLIIYSVN